MTQKTLPRKIIKDTMVFPYHDFISGGRYPAGAEILFSASRYVLSEIDKKDEPPLGDQGFLYGDDRKNTS
jgi:hypothetical protein